MGDHAARRFRPRLCVMVVIALAGCSQGAPNAVDPPLRLAASEFSSNLSTRDVAALAKQGSVQPTNPRLSDILARYGGHPSQPSGFDSADQPGKAVVQFRVSCPSGTTSFDIGFEYANGQWRPVLTTTQSATGSASPARAPTASGAAESHC